MDDPSSSPPDDPTAVPPPEGTPDGVEDYGLTVYDYISIALPGVYWIAYYVVNYLYHKEVRRGMSVSTRAVLPAGGKLGDPLGEEGVNRHHEAEKGHTNNCRISNEINH